MANPAPGVTLRTYALVRVNSGHRWPCDWYERRDCSCGFHEAADYTLNMLFGKGTARG